MAATKKPAVKKPSARAAGATVDGYTAEQGGWRAEAITSLRALVARVAPEATWSIKWGQPVFEAGGPLGFVRAAAAHVTIGFWRGADFDDPDGLLEGEGEKMKHFKLKPGAAIPTAALEGFVREALALNAAKGDPTRRAKTTG